MTIQDTGGTKKSIEAGVARIKEMLPRANAGATPDRARERDHARPAVRRLGRLFRHHRQSRAGRCRRLCWCATAAPPCSRRRRKSMAPSTCSTRRARNRAGGREAGRNHSLVAGLLRQERWLDGQQSEPRQQGRRPYHHPREVAGRGGQGRHHHAQRSLPLRRAGVRPRASSTWTRPATIPSRRRARWPAAATCSASRRVAARPMAASRRRRSSSPPTTTSIAACSTTWTSTAATFSTASRSRPRARRFSTTILRVASGEKTKSELLGYGDNEFVPWQIGATM